jgi:hypothetical protein
MSVTSSDEQWLVCAYCAEIVQRSADPDIAAEHHSASCPARANQQASTACLPYDLPAGIAFAGNGADTLAEPAGSGAVWMTDGGPEHASGVGAPVGSPLAPAPRARPVSHLRRLRLPVSLGLAAAMVVAGGLYAVLHFGGPPSSRGVVNRKPSILPAAPGTAAPALPVPGASLPRGKAGSAVTGSGDATRPGGTVAGPGQSSSVNCTISAALGSCGPYSYAQVTGMTAVSGISIGNNVWNPVSGWAQTLRAASPGDWSVTASMPAGNTTVVSYPSLQADYVQSTSTSVPLSDYASITSSFAETMNATSKTSAWATYEISIGQGSGTSAVADVMIENDLADGSSCSAGTTATFGGSGGVPVQSWRLCTWGSELAWELIGGNEASGTVDILAMVKWLVSHGDLPQNAGLFAISYGWQIVSTGGQNENFQVSNFSITATTS